MLQLKTNGLFRKTVPYHGAHVVESFISIHFYVTVLNLIYFCCPSLLVSECMPDYSDSPAFSYEENSTSD